MYWEVWCLWCFLSIFYLSTLLSINLWSGLLSSVFAWGQARSKLGGSWYVQFASLFYTIIYYYSLIYLVFRYDTYVISSIFACLMIIGELIIAVRILLEKGPSRYNIPEAQEFPENIQKFLFCQKMEEARRRAGGGP